MAKKKSQKIISEFPELVTSAPHEKTRWIDFPVYVDRLLEMVSDSGSAGYIQVPQGFFDGTKTN